MRTVAAGAACWTDPVPAPPPPDAQATGLLSVVALLRLAVLAWAAVVVAIDLSGTTELHAGAAVGALAVLAVWTSYVAWATRRRPRALVASWLVPADVALATVVAASDHLVYEGAHPQTFASAWPLGAVVTAGVLRGPADGAVAGGIVGLGAAIGTAAFRDGGLRGGWTAAVGTLVLLTVAGLLAGVVTERLRRAEATEARARAREEFARELHDGVLQTLAVVQRRSDDTDLVALAREQELELRRFVGDDPGSRGPGPGIARTAADRAAPLVDLLRQVAANAERRTGVRCEVVVVDEPAPLPADVVGAFCGAVTEAATNADKHGAATRVVVCVEVDDGGDLVCTVSDDGTGFEPSSVIEGVGLSRSIRARLGEVGGTAEVRSAPGRGCEVELRLPAGRVARPVRRA